MWTYEFILKKDIKSITTMILNFDKLKYTGTYVYKNSESFSNLEFHNNTGRNKTYQIVFELGKTCNLFNIDEVITEILHSKLNDVYYVGTINYSIYIKQLID
jgi:negative regulator of sigma E activity